MCFVASHFVKTPSCFLYSNSVFSSLLCFFFLRSIHIFFVVTLFSSDTPLVSYHLLPFISLFPFHHHIHLDCFPLASSFPLKHFFPSSLPSIEYFPFLTFSLHLVFSPFYISLSSSSSPRFSRYLSSHNQILPYSSAFFQSLFFMLLS